MYNKYNLYYKYKIKYKYTITKLIITGNTTNKNINK